MSSVTQAGRICFILPHFHLEYRGGAETQCYFLARELLHRGWEVHYIRESDDTESARMDGIEVHAVPKRRKLFKWMNHFHFGSLMKRIGADVWYVRGNTSYLAPVVRHARSAGGVTVWAFSRDSQFSWDNKKIEGRTLHNLAAHLDHGIFRMALKRSDRILLQTEFQRAELAARYGLEGEVIYNAHPLPPGPGSRGERIAAWVGRLQDFKHPERFVALSRHLEGAAVRCCLVGDTPEPKMRARFAEAAAGAPNLQWLGGLDPSGVHDLLTRTRVLVNTSDHEGFSNTFIEAWMRGVPVVSLHVDPDGLIAREGLGYVEPDLAAAAAKVRLLADDRRLWRQLSENCIRVSRRLFRLSDAVDRLEECLRDTRGDCGSSRRGFLPYGGAAQRLP